MTQLIPDNRHKRPKSPLGPLGRETLADCASTVQTRRGKRRLRQIAHFNKKRNQTERVWFREFDTIVTEPQVLTELQRSTLELLRQASEVHYKRLRTAK